MKIKITFLTFIAFCSWSFGQDKAFDLLKDKTATHILYDRVSNISNAENIKTSEISSNYFLQVYHEMQRADFLNRLPKLESIKEQANIGLSQNQIPLSILITDFETIKPEEFQSGKVALNSQQKFETSSNDVFNLHQINLVAPLLGKTKSFQTQFILKDNLVFNTSSRVISYVEIENNGVWQTINFNSAFTINFTQNGLNTINYKIHFTNGDVLTQSFAIEVAHQNRAVSNRNSNALMPNVVNTITSSITYQGYGETAAYAGQGEYEIFLDTVDGVLDKPIILLDGFDPGDSRNTTAIYQLLNYGTGQNLGDVVRAQGFDIIVLNFPTYTRPNTTTVIDGGVDYIQRNAMILVELLNYINTQKVGTQKNVVIGPSMGGLISRYALRYMEQNSLNHDARLYISFDSPHLGANVPIGFQHLFNYMGFGPVGDVTMQAMVNGMLKSPAAREMLIDHFEGHLQSGSATEFNTASNTLLPTGCPNYRTPFQNELNAMGFPQTTRNVSIINGAGNGTMTGTPGMVVMDHTFNTSSTQRAIINLRFTPAANQTVEVSRFKGQQWLLFWVTFYESFANSKAPTYTDGLDAAPGGRFDMNSLAAGSTGNAMLTEFMNNLQIMYFDFIPAISAMAISNTNNYYAPITASSVTPFVASSIPTVNENHVTFNPQNVAFALSEILNPALNTQENSILQGIAIKNPMQNGLELHSSYTIENALVKITDVLGKTVAVFENQSIQGNVVLPIALQSGIYLVTIKTENASVTKKIIKQ